MLPLSSQSSPQDETKQPAWLTDWSLLPFTFNLRGQAKSLDPSAAQTVVIVIEDVLLLLLLSLLLINTSHGVGILRDEGQETSQERHEAGGRGRGCGRRGWRWLCWCTELSRLENTINKGVMMTVVVLWLCGFAAFLANISSPAFYLIILCLRPHPLAK